MIDDVNLPLILVAALVGAASPGPSTLAIAGMSMTSGRRHGLALAAGITTGSFIWSVSAALGLGALMLANVWAFEIIRYFGACYLLFLAYKAARSAFTSSQPIINRIETHSIRRAYAKGLTLHLTNPKAVLFFGSLFAIGVPPESSPVVFVVVILSVGLQSFIIFHGYALLFSNARWIMGYTRLRRWFEALFAVAFGIAALKILTARLN